MIPRYVSLDEYVGITFKDHGRSQKDGLDCWGLFALVQKEKFGIELPGYDAHYVSIFEAEHCNNLINRELDLQEDWVQVPVGYERSGDGMLFFRTGEYHIGTIARPGYVLHIELAGAVIENYTAQRFKRQIVGFYRHKSRV